MKRIFYIYWVWHLLIVTIQILDPKMNYFLVKSFICFSYINLLYISIMPFVYTSTAIKGERSDVNYMYACMASIITNFTFIIVGIAFGRDVYMMIGTDLLTIFLYFGIKWRFSNFSNAKLLAKYRNN